MELSRFNRVPRTSNAFPIIREGLEKAHHALTGLSGLTAADASGDPREVWEIEVTSELDAIDKALRVLTDYEYAVAETVTQITSNLFDISHVLEDMLPH